MKRKWKPRLPIEIYNFLEIVSTKEFGKKVIRQLIAKMSPEIIQEKHINLGEVEQEPSGSDRKQPLFLKKFDKY